MNILNWKSKQGRKHQRGSVLVEAALVTPILVLILAGTLEFGQVLVLQQSLNNAAREGSRVGAIHLDNVQALAVAENVATDYLTRSGVDLSVTAVNAAFTEVNGSEAVALTIDYTFDSSLVRFIPEMSESYVLRSQVSMRREA